MPIEGSAAKLTCRISAFPDPFILWSKDGKELHDGPKDRYVFEDPDVSGTSGARRRAGRPGPVQHQRHQPLWPVLRLGAHPCGSPGEDSKGTGQHEGAQRHHGDAGRGDHGRACARSGLGQGRGGHRGGQQGVLRDRQRHHHADHLQGHARGQRQVRGVRGE